MGLKPFKKKGMAGADLGGGGGIIIVSYTQGRSNLEMRLGSPM